jgi:DNA-binding PadR family transcriptional regulator
MHKEKHMHNLTGRHGGRRGHGDRNLFGGQPEATRGFGRGERHGLFGGRGRHGEHGHDAEGPGGRRGKRFSGDELRLMVLSLLDGEPQHGYQLIRGFAEKSGDAYAPSPGVLYPLLTLLADMELVEEVASESGGSRRSFALTDTGRAELAAQRGVADAAFQRLAEMAGETRRTDPAPVRRAMMNLRTAAIQRLVSGEGGNEVAFRIAAILDEAARTIERLTIEE